MDNGSRKMTMIMMMMIMPLNLPGGSTRQLGAGKVLLYLASLVLFDSTQDSIYATVSQ